MAKDIDEKTTLELSLDELKALYTFLHEAVNFGDERAVKWRDDIGILIKDYEK